MKGFVFIVFFIGCSDESSNKEETEQQPEVEETETGQTSLPTTSEIENAIQNANYCEVAEDCGFVDSCWCGAVANVSELDDLQALVLEWKQDPVNAEYCATSDCIGYSHIVCEQNICVAIEGD